MCGHFGIFGHIGPKLETCFEDGLSFDQIRGPHSTGAAFIEDRTYKVATFKDVVLPHRLYRRPEWPKLMALNVLGIIGHNRMATVGKQIPANAHPFTHGAITMAHNGTLKEKWRLEDAHTFDTDSEALCHTINKVGIERAWRMVNGPATIVYWNANDKSLNFLSNCERPFHYSEVSGGNAIVWCSDNDLLKMALARNGLNTHGKHEQYILESDKLVTWKMKKKGGLSYDVKELETFQEARVLGGNVGTSQSVGNIRSFKGVFKNGKWYDRATGKELDDDTSDPWGDRSGEFNGLPPKIERKATETDVPFARPSISSTMPTSTNTEKTTDPSTQTKAGTSATSTDGLRCDGITETEFHDTYKKCCFCNESLKFEYQEATVLDKKTAACQDCSRAADLSGVRLCS